MDTFLLDLSENRVFEARDFAELPNGMCRIAAPLTHELALSLPHWRECLRPIGAGLANLSRRDRRQGWSRRDSSVEAIAVGSDTSQTLATASLHCEGFMGTAARGARSESDRVRGVGFAALTSGQRDEVWFKREIVPKLDAFTLKEIGKATGLSLAACSRIRAGARVPHPRHWGALLALVNP